jgi:hypothetical protein
VFHRATFSVSESYIGDGSPASARDLSLTPDFSHFILGTRPGRGRRHASGFTPFPSRHAG